MIVVVGKLTVLPAPPLRVGAVGKLTVLPAPSLLLQPPSQSATLPGWHPSDLLRAAPTG